MRVNQNAKWKRDFQGQQNALQYRLHLKVELPMLITESDSLIKTPQPPCSILSWIRIPQPCARTVEKMKCTSDKWEVPIPSVYWTPAWIYRFLPSCQNDQSQVYRSSRFPGKNSPGERIFLWRHFRFPNLDQRFAWFRSVSWQDDRKIFLGKWSKV